MRGIHRSPVNFPHKGQDFDVFFDLRSNKRLSKQSRRRWFETSPRSLWRHCNVIHTTHIYTRRLLPGSTPKAFKSMVNLLPNESYTATAKSLVTCLVKFLWWGTALGYLYLLNTWGSDIRLVDTSLMISLGFGSNKTVWQAMRPIKVKFRTKKAWSAPSSLILNLT